jgi:hypothetical protein
VDVVPDGLKLADVAACAAFGVYAAGVVVRAEVVVGDATAAGATAHVSPRIRGFAVVDDDASARADG